MISTSGASPVRSSTASGRADDRPHLHLVDLRAQSSPSRQPRVPSIGFDSCSAWIRSRIRSSVASSSGGRNSCSGGSSRRIVTGRPAIASKIPSKSACWSGSSLSSAARRSSSSEAMIISRTTGSRSSAMNMCSVRQRPIPCAPNSRALAASSGVSAFARTFRRRSSSAQPRIVSKSSLICGGTSGDGADDHAAGAAVDRDRVALGAAACPPIAQRARVEVDRQRPRSRRRRACPSRARRRPRARSSRRGRSGSPLPGSGRGCRRGSSPSGRGSRSPRPCRAPRPCRRRTRPRRRRRPARRSGPARRPRARAAGSIIGCSSWSSCAGSIRATASSREIRPSSTIATAAFSAAAAVRLAERVCSR